MKMKNFKKSLTVALCIVLCMGITACGIGEETKRSSKDISKDAEKIGDDITCGEFVLNGKVYSFPMKLSEFTDDGWYISKNFKETKLESESYSDTFEIYKSNSKHYLTISLYNDTDTITDIHDCLIYSLYIRNNNFNVTYPGGLTEKSSADDIINAYGNGSINDKDDNLKRVYSFNGNNDISCLVELTASTDEGSKNPFTSAEYYIRWNKNNLSADERCRLYFDTAMKASFHGNFDEYVDAEFDTLKNAQTLYESEMEYYAEALMYYTDVDASVVDEDIYNQFVEIAKNVLSKTQWSIDELEVDNAYNGKITITLIPTNFFEVIDTSVINVIEEFNKKYGNVDYENIDNQEYTELENEYAKNILSEIEGLTDEIVLSTSVTVSYDIDGLFILTDENWEEIDDIIMDISED